MKAPVDTPVLNQLETWFTRREYGRIIYTCDRLLKQASSGKMRPQLLLWKGRAHLQAGPAYIGQAISSFKEGIDLAKQNRSLKAELLVSLSCAYTDAGDCSATEKLVGEIERLAEDQHPDIMAWALVLLFNHGVNLDNAFRLEEAAATFKRAAELARSFEDEVALSRCLHNLGGVMLALGRVAEAHDYMVEAEGLMSEEQMGHKKLSRRAEYYLAASHLDQAEHYIRAALSHPKVDDMTMADLHYTWAQILRQRQLWEEAQEKAFRGLEYAVKAVHYPGIHKINQFLQLGPLAM